jgi:uncharacterized membrane protein YbaN (DUF454 family)
MGVLGALLPILPGWLFFAIALMIFAEESPLVRGWIRRLRQRWPKFSGNIHRAAQHRRAPRMLRDFARSTDPLG